MLQFHVISLISVGKAAIRDLFKNYYNKTRLQYCTTKLRTYYKKSCDKCCDVLCPQTKVLFTKPQLYFNFVDETLMSYRAISLNYYFTHQTWIHVISRRNVWRGDLLYMYVDTKIKQIHVYKNIIIWPTQSPYVTRLVSSPVHRASVYRYLSAVIASTTAATTPTNKTVVSSLGYTYTFAVVSENLTKNHTFWVIMQLVAGNRGIH